jgi:serine/threonine protein kinase/tetratricopeptide (TPR) repeat protein
MSLRDRLLEPRGLFHGALFQDMLRTHFDAGCLQAGVRVGAFRIVRELGRGGMGVVYLAERADGEFEQSVALKWLHDANLSPESAALFRRERQFLAELSHPNIARLIDGGRTDEGHLWFAMEYVEGLPIDRHADTHHLDERQRVELMLPVLQAVEFAHGRLLIHRDLKPGNVMIDAGGRAKLLDFGIAGLAQERDQTSAFTPEYASPEQRALGPVGTASDVWQLGRLLQAVLAAGTTQAPSRDLQAIIAKASADAPGQRYVTATALKYDLERYLAHRPVQARQGGLAYRSARLMQRHPVGSLSAGLVTLGVITLVAGFLYYAAAERTRLRQARDETLAVNRFLNEDVLGAGDPFVGSAKDTPISDILEAALDKAERRFADHPGIAGRVQTTIGYTLMSRGHYASAEDASRRASRLLLASDGEHAESTGEARLLRAMLDMQMGDAPSAQKKLEALQSRFPYDEEAPTLLQFRIQGSLAWNALLGNDADACTRIYMRILAHARGIPDNELSDGYNGLSLCQSNLARFDEALRSARRSEAYSVRFSGADSGIASLSRVRVATALSGLGRHDEATRILQREVANLSRLLGDDHSTTVTYVNLLGSMHLCANDNAQAAAWLERAVEGRRRSVGASHVWTTGTTAQYVVALIRSGQATAAQPFVDTLAALGPVNDDPSAQMWIDRALGEWHLRRGDREQALAYYRSARELALASNRRIRSNLHAIEAGYGLSLAQAGRTEEALAAYERAIAAIPDASRCSSPLTLDAERDRQRLLAVSKPR